MFVMLFCNVIMFVMFLNPHYAIELRDET